MANSLDAERSQLQDQAALLDPQPPDNTNYRPNKRKRAIRRQVYDRYYWLRGEPLRQEAETDWETADKEYSQYFVAPDADDWRSHLELPDAFAAIQSDMQEGVERRSRPTLKPTEDSDEPLAEFSNAVINYNMDNTGFDYQYFLAKLASRIRGTAFLMDYWRVEKRVVKDPTGLKDGEVQYQDKEIVDFDDDYTEWVPNEFIYLDEKAKDVDEAVDMFRREILNIEEFHRIYGKKPGFFDTSHVMAGGDTSTRSFFQLPKDITSRDVEVLHYYNRSVDAYWVVANNILIHDSPLPTKHKELPLAAIHCYRVPGRFWSMGVPKIMHMLSEERKAIRRLNLDRQKLNIAGAFLHNTAFDIDDEDATLQPGRFIQLESANGQDIRQSIMKLEFGDVPASAFRTEEILLDDITRATGINPLAEAQATGGTATQAAILKENTLKRINMIALTNEMQCIVRLGRLKWANIQFFYGIPRMQKITQDGQEQQQKVYRTVTVQNQKFDIADENGKKVLRMDDIQGSSALKIDKSMAKYLEFSYDVTVDADIFTPVSKAIEQTKKTEVFSLLLSNPATLSIMDLVGATSDFLKTNNIEADKWLKNSLGKKDMQMLAESENMVMGAGQPLDGTPDATEEHTLVHLMFTKTPDFMSAPHEIQQIIMDHILQEHDANPATGASADLMGAYGLGAEQGAPGGGPGGPQAGEAAPLALSPQTTQPQAQVADLSPTNFANPE